jgi:hypothetical protein
LVVFTTAENSPASMHRTSRCVYLSRIELLWERPRAISMVMRVRHRKDGAVQ